MNPLLASALGSIVRAMLIFCAGWLVNHGIWTQADAETYAAAASLAIVSVGWSIFQKYKSRVSFLTALQAPQNTSEATVKRWVDSGLGASVKTSALVLTCIVAWATLQI